MGKLDLEIKIFHKLNIGNRNYMLISFGRLIFYIFNSPIIIRLLFVNFL